MSINDPRISDNYPSALDDATPCYCGGTACYRPPGRKADVSRLECSNARCGRLVAIGNFRGLADAVTRWNDECREESCLRHSWVRHDGTDGPACKAIYACIHCGKVMEQ